jgi:metal-responsive CopG/Arc/MetJ family transcriptional regulator
MVSVRIAFPESMLERIDKLAKACGMSRSDLVRQAVSGHLARTEHAAEMHLRAERIRAAQARMATIGARLKPGPYGVTLIRQMRDAGRP